MSNVSRAKGKMIEITDPFARRLIGKYLDNRKDDIDKLTAALSKRDFETIRTTGHNLYGSGAAYGLDDISWIGRSIESAAVAGNAGEVQEGIDQLQAFLQRLKLR